MRLQVAAYEPRRAGATVCCVVRMLRSDGRSAGVAEIVVATKSDHGFAVYEVVDTLASFDHWDAAKEMASLKILEGCARPLVGWRRQTPRA